MILPNRLEQGDTISIITSASSVETEKLKDAIPFFENLGLHVRLGKYIDQKNGYLAGTDKERLADFHDMVKDDDVKAIFFGRGGYGTGRIAPLIDYQLVKNNPKIIWGYSDITYLHTAIQQNTGLVTFHGPMVVSDIAKKDFDGLSAKLFKQLFQPTELVYTESISPLHVYAGGEGRGQLVGGNLSLLTSTIGTPYEIETEGKILLVEDIGEEPYRVDAMLNQLKLAGKFNEVAGIVVGDFAETDSILKAKGSLANVFEDYFANLSCPVVSGFKIGHCFPHFSVPLGTQTELLAEEKTLKIAPGVQ